MKGAVLVFPACIGSTYTGMMIMQLLYDGAAPATIVVRSADSLLVSGIVLGEVWFGRGVPVVEVGSEEIFERIRNGDRAEVDGSAGEIRIP